MFSNFAVEDEGHGRYNLATKVMSNGVEVIVALDKSTLPGSPQLLRVLPSMSIRPITLTPSIVTDHMIMMLPHGLQVYGFLCRLYSYSFSTSSVSGILYP